MENYNPDNPKYEPVPMSNREINDIIICSVGQSILSGTPRDF